MNADLNEVLALRSNPETMKYIPLPLLKSEEEALAHIAMIDETHMTIVIGTQGYDYRRSIFQ